MDYYRHIVCVMATRCIRLKIHPPRPQIWKLDSYSCRCRRSIADTETRQSHLVQMNLSNHNSTTDL